MPNRNINDFFSASWNTQGARWADIVNLLNNANSRIDIFAIQESGNIPDIWFNANSRQTCARATEDAPNVCLVNQDDRLGLHTMNTFYNYGAIEYSLEIPVSRPNPNTFSSGYIYHYCGLQNNPRTNMSIVSRYRANQIILILPIIAETVDSRDLSTYNINSHTSESLWTRRPVLGIRIGNSLFFNIHGASMGASVVNESPLLVTVIENYLYEHHSNASALIMGDFNYGPQNLEGHLVPLHDNTMSRRILSQTQGTQQRGNILDYGIWLGNRAIVAALTVTLLTMRNSGVPTGSDHFPILFRKN